MTHAVRFVAVVAVLTALALCVRVQAQTPEETDALRVRAEAGDTEAQFSLGRTYEYGLDLPEDAYLLDAEAARWFRLAADQGHADAQYYLGDRCWTGRGVPQDAAEALRWYHLAADQGVAEAQYILGVEYWTGQNFPQDYVQAHMWHSLAAARSTAEEDPWGEMRERAVRERDRVAGQMTPTQIAEAQRLAHEWDAAHPREPHCTPCPPAVGSVPTSASSWSSEDSP